MRQLIDQFAAAAGAFALSLALIAGTLSVPAHSSHDDAAPAAAQEMI
ncbi:hypothetical protein HGI47_08715 [Novosphingobium sp. ERN07]|nr:hypothetical protein [Novosphingobium sp. ERN07]NLR70953.1 hypothetical protein [Novosphingobium sp. ERN07]